MRSCAHSTGLSERGARRDSDADSARGFRVFPVGSRMIDEKDIWRVARPLIRTHCEHGETVAAHHVDERRAQGDLIGRDIWRQIVAAIDELQRVNRREDEPVKWEIGLPAVLE
jgi:hypothetical protein